ncbi:MAG: hypothetical protein ACYCWE_09355 [Eubacteriales bacterium]
MKRIFALLLALLLMIPAAACSDNVNTDAAGTTSAETAAVTEEEDTDSLDSRKNVSDDLPEADFEGSEFLIIIQKDYEYDGFIEELTGDALDDAIYNRNERVKERFNINIAVESGGDSGAMSSKINKTVKAGDDAYDLCMAHIIQTGTDITNGIFYNWMDIPNVDITKPWYPQYAAQASVVNGKLYALVSDAALSSVIHTYCVYFNKNIAADYNLESNDIYASVRDGNWTIDTMSEYIKPVYQDLNGNGEKDAADLYGNKTLLFYSFNFMWAFDQPAVEINDNEIKLVINTEKMVDILNRLYDFYHTQDGVFLTEYVKSKEMFAAGESLFLMCHFLPAMQELRSMEQDYGIVPFPKWNEEQSSYRTTVDGCFDVLVVPVTVPTEELDKVGIMTEALSADSWKNVLPVFYDVALKVKGTRDEESVEMIDIVLNGRVIDFSWIYTGWGGFNFVIYDLLNTKKSGGDFASFYEKNEKSKTKVYEKAFDFFFEG